MKKNITLNMPHEIIKGVFEDVLRLHDDGEFAHHYDQNKLNNLIDELTLGYKYIRQLKEEL